MVMQAIIDRKSVRNYADKEVSDEDIKKILEAGILAPSWVNVQPWHFIVIKDKSLKEFICKVCANQAHIKNASALICAIADVSAWERKNFSKVMEKQGRNLVTREFILNHPVLNPSLAGEYEKLLRTIEQMSYAIGFMTLEAQELGIGTCIIGAAANELNKGDSETINKVRETLNLNEKQILHSVLTLGYEKDPKIISKSRKEFDEVVSFEKLGQKYE